MPTPDDEYRFFPLRDTEGIVGVPSVIEVLCATSQELREAGTADEALNIAAQAIARAGLYRRSVLTLHNEQGDIIALGYHGLPDEVVAAARRARRVSAEKRQAVLDSANRLSQSYFIPAELGLDLSGEGRYIKSDHLAQGRGSWQPEDQLFVPIHDYRGSVVGYASVDTPVDGRRPDLTSVRHLELVISLVEKALTGIRVGEGTEGLSERLQRLVTTAGDVVFHADLTTKSLVYVNPAVEKLLGYSVEQLLPQPIEKLWKMFVPPEDRKAVWPKWSGGKQVIAADRRQHAAVDFYVRRKDGALRRVRGSRTVIYDGDRRAIAVEGILRDVTDQLDTQRRLAELEQRYQNLKENTPDLVYMRDLEGRLLDVSDAARSFWGLAPDAVIGTLLADWLVDIPVNRGAFEVATTAIMQGRTIPPYSIEMHDCTGRSFFVELQEYPIRDGSGRVIAVQGICRNPDGRGQNKDDLQRSERKFRELAELLPQTVFEVDLNGTLTYANRFGIAAFGYDAADAKREVNVTQLFIAEDAERLITNRQRILAAGASPGHEYTALRKDGGTFPVMVYSSPIIQNGAPVGFRGIVLDLTERKLAEHALRDQETRYRSLFENSPVTMIEEDWSQLKEHIDQLNKTGVADLQDYFDQHPQELEYCWSLIEVKGINNATVSRFGAASKEEFLADLEKITTVESFAALGRAIVTLHRGQTMYSGEDVARRLDGERVYSDVRLSIVPGHEHDWSKIIVSVVDITERKRATEHLRREHDFIHSLLDTANSLIFCMDNQARITVFNKELEKVTGYTRDEVLGRCWPEIFLPAGFHTFKFEDFGEWVRQHPRDTYEGPLVTKSGEIRTILWSNSALFTEDSDQLTAVAVGQDITDRKLIEKALYESEQRYHELFSSVMEGICMVDEHEIMQYCNPAFAAILEEKSPEVLTGRSLLDYVPIDQKAKILAETEKRRHGEDSQYEIDIITATKKRKTILASISHRFDEAGRYVGAFGIALDITERKKAEEAVRHSEEQFRTFAENIPGVVCIYDEYPDGRREPVYIGPGLEELLGRKLANSIGNDINKFMELIVPDDLQQLQAESDRILAANEVLDFEYRIRIAPGHCKWLRIICRATRREDGSIRWEGQGFDVTDRKEAEEAVRRSEEQFRTFAENIPGIVCIYDEYPGGHREPVYIGPGLERLLGRKLAHQIGNDINKYMELIVPDDLRRLQAESDRVVASGEALDFEYRIHIAPGRWKWVRVIYRATCREDGSIRWEGLSFDVTDRKEALDALRSSEETSRALLNATHDSVLLVKFDGTVLAANDTAIDTLGVDTDQFIGSCAFDAMPPALVEMRKAYGRQVVESGRPGRFQDERQGRLFDYTIYPIFDEAGKVERLAIFARDVTDREKMLKQLREKSAALDRANAVLEDVVAELRRKHERARELSEKFQAKNEELESLVSMISHDLKSPLISIHELTGLFRRRYARLIDEAGQGMARRISSNAAQMLRLVESLLDYSRVPERIVDIEDVDLSLLIDDVWDQVTDAFPGRQAVLRRPEGEQFLACSQMALERVLLNLFRNAIAYVPEDRQPLVSVNWQQTAESMIITIADNGCGIPEDKHEKVFELFYRVEPAVTEGSGIGLAVVKKIIDAAQGTITLTSTPGQGTVFTITVPLQSPS